MRAFKINHYAFAVLAWALVWNQSTGWGTSQPIPHSTTSTKFDVIQEPGSQERIVSIENPELGKKRALDVISSGLSQLSQKSPNEASFFIGRLSSIEPKAENFATQIDGAINESFEGFSEPVRGQIKDAVIAQMVAGGDDAAESKKFKEQLIQTAKGAIPSPSSSPQPGQSAQSGKEVEKTPEQLAAEEKLKKEQKEREEAQKIQDAINQQQQLAALQAAQQAQNARNGAGGGGGGGGGSGGGSGGGGGGNPGGFGGGDLPQSRGISDRLQPNHRDKTPSLSELRGSLPNFSNQQASKSPEEKREEPQFKFGSDSKKSTSSLNDTLGGLKPKESSDPTKDLADGGVQDPAAGLPGAGQPGGLNSAILAGNSSVPQEIPNQYAGAGALLNASLDASFGGGGGGGFGGASVGGGAKPAGGGAGGDGGFSVDGVGRGEPFTPEPTIKKIAQDLGSGGGGGSDGEEEGDGGGGSYNANDYTSKKAIANGTGLFINQIVLTGSNSRANGRGIMAYTNILGETCDSEQGKLMALCLKAKHKGNTVSTKK